MRKELENRLYKDYPKIFKQKDLAPSETCMCWGIECDDGWFTILNHLCYLLQVSTGNNHPQVEAVQIKEKFGTLRFYTEGHDDYQDGLIDFACLLSSCTCEICGSTKDLFKTKGWIKTVCKECHEKRHI